MNLAKWEWTYRLGNHYKVLCENCGNQQIAHNFLQVCSTVSTDADWVVAERGQSWVRLIDSLLPRALLWGKINALCCRVERSVESQVQKAAFNSCWQHQCDQSHRLSVPRRSHWWWRPTEAPGSGRSPTAVSQFASTTPQVRTPASFRPTISCHQEGARSSVAGCNAW